MKWEKQVSRRGATDGGWKDDFPLEHGLPELLTVDCTLLEMPIYPLFMIRLRTFLVWHAEHGRQITLVRPENPEARRFSTPWTCAEIYPWRFTRRRIQSPPTLASSSR